MVKATGLPGIVEATRSYEAWMQGHARLRADDLDTKHRRMAASPLEFLRGTFYRYVQCWPDLAGVFPDALTVPAVGDIHLENFGTWRDAAGRLVWGVNDFDEAWALPYALDLVRLGVSVRLAIQAGDLTLPDRDIAPTVLDGYREGLESGGRPFVLEADHAWLRKVVTAERNAERYWAKLQALPQLQSPEPAQAADVLRSAMPSGSDLRFAHRTAGLGSLGRDRLLALTEWCGGPVAMEAKALVPSAAAWAGEVEGAESAAESVLARTVRSRDPSALFRKGYSVRRLSPSAQRLDLADLATRGDERRLLSAMGQEIANVHLGEPAQGPGVVRDLGARGEAWFSERMEQGAAQVMADWKAWQQR
jgi:Uncharacterized protein conserved in bacteria (DUF2252)